MVHLVESGEQRYAIKTIQLHNEKRKVARARMTAFGRKSSTAGSFTHDMSSKSYPQKKKML